VTVGWTPVSDDLMYLFLLERTPQEFRDPDSLPAGLVHLLEGYGQRKAEPSCHVRVSQERLGTILSLSRQTVNELLRHLEQEGVIQCQRGGVRVLDPRRLRDAAQAPS